MVLLNLCQGCYLVKQAYYQNNLINSRKPIDEILHSNTIDKKTHHKLKLLKKILIFAKNNGLNTENAYGYYVSNNSDHVSFIVGAAKINRLKSKQWWFPIVGSVPYLGFFNKNDRDIKATQLKSEGLDIYKGRAGAFSSLGYFEDPIYSSMLNRSDENFVQLIFHELVHRTIWDKGSVGFNENLAEFIADKLLEKFSKFHNLSYSYELPRNRIKRKTKLYNFLKHLKEDLQKLYDQYPEEIPPLQTKLFLTKRQKIIELLKEKYYNPSRTSFDKMVLQKTWNNAIILASSLYLPDQDSFFKAYSCQGESIKNLIMALKNKLNEFEESFEALNKICQKPN